NTANGLGLYDMSGNVWELCWDWKNGSPKRETVLDPLGTQSGTNRIRRGGSYSSQAAHCCVSCRLYLLPCERKADFGLRLVCRE
ncbi:MAG: SUMF1/EgtB/PvdO family nonheme iron enzyme, partial [Spirochaetales bacterium]|nr:SUMF1/EgtB/PvdO family nonheme iron enzyme [Spirochaetales bacterium]